MTKRLLEVYPKHKISGYYSNKKNRLDPIVRDLVKNLLQEFHFIKNSYHYCVHEFLKMFIKPLRLMPNLILGNRNMKFVFVVVKFWQWGNSNNIQGWVGIGLRGLKEFLLGIYFLLLWFLFLTSWWGALCINSFMLLNCYWPSVHHVFFPPEFLDDGSWKVKFQARLVQTVILLVCCHFSDCFKAFLFQCC